MTGSDLTRHQERSDEANNLVPLLLGVLKLLDEFAAAATEGAATVGAGEDDGVGDDGLMAAALGLLSLRRTAWRWAGHAACDHPSASHRTHEALSPMTRLLR